LSLYRLCKEYYPLANNKEIELFISLNNDDEIMNLAIQKGWQDKDKNMIELKKELKRRSIDD
jgi:hypothetical protein